MSTARVDFTRGAAERIARVVRIVEQGERDQSGPTYGSVVTGAGSGSSAAVFRVGTYTGAWAIDTLKTVTFRNVTTTPNTVRAVNLFAQLAAPTVSTAVCAIAREGTGWYLVAARCP